MLASQIFDIGALLWYPGSASVLCSPLGLEVVGRLSQWSCPAPSGRGLLMTWDHVLFFPFSRGKDFVFHSLTQRVVGICFYILTGSQSFIVVLICISFDSSKFEHILYPHLPFICFCLCHLLTYILFQFSINLFYIIVSRTPYIIRTLSLFLLVTNIFPV